MLAIAGDDFTVIASDLRLSEGFQIYTRESPKTYKLWVNKQYNNNVEHNWTHQGIVV